MNTDCGHRNVAEMALIDVNFVRRQLLTIVGFANALEECVQMYSRLNWHSKSLEKFLLYRIGRDDRSKHAEQPTFSFPEKRHRI